MMSRFEFPILEGWQTVSQVAEVLNVSRQAVHKMLGSGIFGEDAVRQVGSDYKPVYLVRDEALSRVLQERGNL